MELYIFQSLGAEAGSVVPLLRGTVIPYEHRFMSKVRLPSLARSHSTLGTLSRMAAASSQVDLHTPQGSPRFRGGRAVIAGEDVSHRFITFVKPFFLFGFIFFYDFPGGRRERQVTNLGQDGRNGSPESNS